MECVGKAIGAYVPAQGEGWYGLELSIGFHEGVVNHVVYPHHIEVFGECGVHGLKVAGGDIEVEDFFGGGSGVAIAGGDYKDEKKTSCKGAEVKCVECCF